MNDLLRQAEDALADGRISAAEHAYLVRRLSGKTTPVQHDAVVKNKRPRDVVRLAAAALAFAIIVNLLALSLWPTQHASTGFAVAQPNTTIREPTILLINATDLISLKVTGTLENGTGEIWLDRDETRLLVYRGEAAMGILTTEKISYATGEVVYVGMTSDDPSTLWLTDPAGAKTPAQREFVPQAPGGYVLDALIGDGESAQKQSVAFFVREMTDPANDIPRIASTSFIDACEQTCSFAATGDASLSLVISMDAGATITLLDITTATQQNRPPMQGTPIPDIKLVVGESSTLNLSQHFTDPDGDPLSYDTMNIPGATMAVTDGILTMTANEAGVHESVVYAADRQALVQSNAFTVTITATAVENITDWSQPNATLPNDTLLSDTFLNSTNETIQLRPGSQGVANASDNATAQQTPTGSVPANSTSDGGVMSGPATSDCDDPDPNVRPESCFAPYLDDAFLDPVAHLKNAEQATVGRFTRFGNLIISGVVQEQSGSAPAQGDFVIGYTTQASYREELHPTAWIETASGDLHLAGRLYEERGALSPPQYGSYIVQNRIGIILAYFDKQSGDLYLKGNVVRLGRPG